MAPKRFINGVTNVEQSKTMGQYLAPDPTKVHQFFNDFDYVASGDWTITETQAGATEALTDGDGGRLLITNSAADDDKVALQKVGESFKFVSGKKLWFKALLQVSDATQSDFVMGLQITDTTPLAVSDGVFFQKDDGDTNLDFHVVKNSIDSASSGIGTVANATDISMGFYYDGISTIYVYVNDILVATTTPGTSLPDDEELTISFALQNGEAVAKTMTVDYILAAKER